MTDPRIEKVTIAIDKTKTTILDYQRKLRDLEREKIRLENARIVALVRGESISDAELNALMQSFRKDTAPIEDSVDIITSLEDTMDDNY